MIENIYLDDIVACGECGGRGWREYPGPLGHNERVKQACEQCTGTGLLQVTGKLYIKPYNPPYHHDRGVQD